MLKKEPGADIFSITIGEITLFVLSIFAFGFIVGETNLVSAQSSLLTQSRTGGNAQVGFYSTTTQQLPFGKITLLWF